MQTLSYGELNFSVKYHLSESFTHLTYFEAISLMKTKKNWGVVYIPPEITKTKISLSV